DPLGDDLPFVEVPAHVPEIVHYLRDVGMGLEAANVVAGQVLGVEDPGAGVDADLFDPPHPPSIRARIHSWAWRSRSAPSPGVRRIGSPIHISTRAPGV